LAGAVRRLRGNLGFGALKPRALLAPLLRPGRDVLPVYHPDRPGWVVAARRLSLLIGIMFVAFVYGVLAAILPPSMMMGAVAPLAFLAVLVIWALPDVRTAPTRALTKAFTFFLLSIILWPNYIAISIGGLPWISMRRLAGFVLSMLLVISISTSKPFRQGMADVFRASPWLARCLIAFFIFQAFASIFSVDPRETIGRFINGTFTSTAVCFTAVWLFGPGEKTILWFTNRFLAAVFVLMIIGVFEARAQHVLWVGNIPSFLRIDDATLQQLTRPLFRGWYRVVTTYTTPLAYGELLALTTPFVLYRIVHADTWSRRGWWIFFDLFLLASVLLSAARLSLVGYIASHAIFGLLWGIHRWRNARGDMLGISATMLYPAFLVALALAVVVVPAVHVRVLGGGAAQASTDARSVQFHMAVPVILRRPLLGYGPGEGGGAINYRTPDGNLTIDLGLVALAADLGLLGLGAYMGILILSIVALIRIGFRQRSSPFSAEFGLATALCVLITTRLVLAQGDNDAFFDIMFGLAIGAIYLAKREQPTTGVSVGAGAAIRGDRSKPVA
jgi:hypothetical protein